MNKKTALAAILAIVTIAYLVALSVSYMLYVDWVNHELEKYPEEIRPYIHYHYLERSEGQLFMYAGYGMIIMWVASAPFCLIPERM